MTTSHIAKILLKAQEALVMTVAQNIRVEPRGVTSARQDIHRSMCRILSEAAQLANISKDLIRGICRAEGTCTLLPTDHCVVELPNIGQAADPQYYLSTSSVHADAMNSWPLSAGEKIGMVVRLKFIKVPPWRQTICVWPQTTLPAVVNSRLSPSSSTIKGIHLSSGSSKAQYTYG